MMLDLSPRPLGASWVPLGGLVGPLVGLLGASWRPLGGLLGGLLAPPRHLLGTSLSTLGSLSGYLWALFAEIDQRRRAPKWGPPEEANV
eukprot:1945409-Pyramimonas_sp.AAC.1